MAILSKRIPNAVKPMDYVQFANEHPDSHSFIQAGITKGMLFGAGLEAACVAGALKTKNPAAKVAFGAGAIVGMLFCAAGGYIMGCELEAAEWIPEEEPVEEFEDEENIPDDFLEEDEPEEPEPGDDGIIIE